MKAISIRQPWAWMILHAGKNIENRTWETFHRGRVLIHASKGCTQAEYHNAIEGALMLDLPAKHTEALLNIPDLKTIERGGIIGSVEIVACVRGKHSAWHAEGQFGFVLRNPQPLPFTPWKGQLGFFDVPPSAMVETESVTGDQTCQYDQRTEPDTRQPGRRYEPCNNGQHNSQIRAGNGRPI